MTRSGFWPLVLLLAAPTVSAQSAAGSPAKASPPSPPAPAARLRTEVLKPSPVKIALDSLPKPFATESASKSPKVVDVPAEPTLRVPAGFTVNLYADKLQKPRWMVLTPEGDVLVVESRANRIYRLKDADKDGVAESREVFADESNNLDLPFGMAFSDSLFFVGNTNGVRSYSYTKGQKRLEGKGNEVTSLPGRGYNQHWTRNVRVAPDGKRLFVTVGSESNVDVEESPRASVLVMALDGSGRQVYGSGLRNPVGLDFHPRTGEPYVTVNERDGLGDDLVPDYFTRVQQGGFYGWPYAYLSPKNIEPRRTKDGRSEQPELAAKTLTPDVLFPAHSAALGLTFYRGTAFPERYRGGAFVAFRGSWNRSEGTGYKIVFVPFDAQGRPAGGFEDFLTGFLVDPKGPSVWARPVGLLELPDGSLLLTDDANSRIYRIAFQAPASGK